MPGLLSYLQTDLPASVLGCSNQSFIPPTREKDLVDLRQSWSCYYTAKTLTSWLSLPWPTDPSWSGSYLGFWPPPLPQCPSELQAPTIFNPPCHPTPPHHSLHIPSATPLLFISDTLILPSKPFPDINSTVVSQTPFYTPHPHKCLNQSCIFLPCFWALCACLSFVYIFGLICDVVSF